jgi:antitoxin (DNA-binding transcriptional repressor) of toxin-antitoxin stability system
MAAKTVTIEEAQTSLPELIALVEEGNEVIIAKGKKPLAKLAPLAQPRKDGIKVPRLFGQYKGQVRLSDDFDAPLPEKFWLGNDAT